jgi:hypothetical protein
MVIRNSGYLAWKGFLAPSRREDDSETIPNKKGLFPALANQQ